MEYFNIEALFKMSKGIGRPIKMDIQAREVTRGRFAQVCIEMDIKNPLTPFIRINQHNQEVAYELNTCFCHKCGIIGHLPVQCINTSQNLGTSNSHAEDNKSKSGNGKSLKKKRSNLFRSKNQYDQMQGKVDGEKEKTSQRQHDKNSTKIPQRRQPQQQ